MQVETQMTELQELECLYSELYKGVYGVKARWYVAVSVDQARRDIEQLEAEGRRVAEHERIEQEKATVQFEARVQQIIETGAKDRATAMRWIHDAEGTQGDNDYLCYCLGLPYGYIK